MAYQETRFNKTKLQGLVQAGIEMIVKDTEVSGLKFKVGKKRSVFFFEKRVSGKKKASAPTITIGAFPTVSIEDARQEAREYANLCEKGIDPRKGKTVSDDSVILMKDAIEKFFQLKAEVSKNTYSDYQQIVKHQFASGWMERDIRSISPDEIVEQFHINRVTAEERCWKFLRVYHNLWSSCSPFFRDASGNRLLGTNPIGEVREMLKNVPRHTPKRSVIPETVLGRFVVTVEKLARREIPFTRERGRKTSIGAVRTCHMILLSLFTAFRLNEARCLEWDHVDLENGIIWLPGCVREEGKAFSGTKNGRDHWVHLSSYALDLLKRLHETRQSTSPYVFPAVKDRSQPLGKYQSVYKRISEILGIHFSAHVTRRTFASVADEAGLGYLTLKRMLNHAFQGGVTDKYVVQGFNPSKQKAHFQKVCDYILERRAEYLGELERDEAEFDREAKLKALHRQILEMGLDPKEALEALVQEQEESAA